jgi:acetoin:2,6-dichlorophenolindophenol oxidoreductase subunit beta
MSELSYRQAVARALEEEMLRDDRIVLLGEDIGAAGGVFKLTEGLFARFGPGRVRDTPISEQAIIGAAIGAALTGLRPVAELMFSDFAGVAFDQIANQLAKYRYMTGGQARVPVTVRLVGGAGLGFGAQHSQTTENWLLNVPGLKIAVPGTPRDLLGLLKSAIRSDDPVLVFEHKGLHGLKEEIRDSEVIIPMGSASVVREGDDLTIVATQLMRHRAEKALSRLDALGVSTELIDPRTLVPLDIETIAASVAKTGRLVIVQEAPVDGSWGAALLAHITSHAFSSLTEAPILVAPPDTPIPFASNLEARWIPTEEDIIQAAVAVTGKRGSSVLRPDGRTLVIPAAEDLAR